MKYRQIKTSFWEDGYIYDLNSTEKLVFMYLLTNPKVNMCGIYELPDKIISSTLDITLDELTILKQKFESDSKYYFKNGWICIVNFTEHNEYSSAPNIVKTIIKDFNAVPMPIKDYFFDIMKLQYTVPIKNNIDVKVNDKVMVNVNVNVKEGRGYPRIRHNEDINPDDVPI